MLPALVGAGNHESAADEEMYGAGGGGFDQLLADRGIHVGSGGQIGRTLDVATFYTVRGADRYPACIGDHEAVTADI
jgi:hypothetical protein